MKPKAYVFITTLFFLSLVILHVSRLAQGWEATVNGLDIPAAWSVFMLLLSLWLMASGFHIFKKMK